MRQLTRLSACVILCGGLLALAALAGPPDPTVPALPVAPLPAPSPIPPESGAEQKPAVVTRLYDVRDLLFTIPDFTGSAQLGSQRLSETTISSGAGGLFGGAGVPTHEGGKSYGQLTDDLVRLIQKQVSSGTWRETGGEIGQITVLNGALVVTQTPDVQKQIADLLTEFRRAAAPANVRVRAHWILTRRGDLDRILKPLVEGGATLWADPAALDALPGATHFRGETLAIVGQRVYVQDTRAQTTVTDLSPEVDNGVARSDPTLEALTSGLLLDVITSLSADRHFAIVTLRSQWVDAGSSGPPGRLRRTVIAHPNTRPANVPPTTAPAASSVEITGFVEPTRVSEHDLKTSARLPLGKTVLIGGMTLDPISPAAAAAGDHRLETPQLYLFLEVTAD